MKSPKIIKCPICEKRFLKHSLTQHIVQQGQREIYKVYIEKGYVAIGSEGKPHEDFVRSNLKNIKKFSLNAQRYKG